MMSTSKKLGFLTLILIAGIGLSGCTKYVKGDIDDIVYAEPSEEAKNFDIEGYINSLPQVEYDKIDYPIKETYTYNFNGYSMTIDIPEGFEAYEIPLTEKPEVYRGKKKPFYECGKDGCQGPARRNVLLHSASTLCIKKSSKEVNGALGCVGDGFVKIYPSKSKFRGISLRDMEARHYKEFGDKYSGGWRSITDVYDEKFQVDNISFYSNIILPNTPSIQFDESGNQSISRDEVTIKLHSFLSNQQKISSIFHEKDKDMIYSMLSSMKLKE